jgi:glyoxylase-like metal-dependent hydrolase (beta-lactamase superfamily II)
MSEHPLYFKQILAGRQVACTNPAAGQMANFMYLLGDSERREALVVDPAWDVEGLLDLATADGYSIVGALVTHYHPDHVGGDLWGLQIEGLSRLLERQAMPVFVNKNEAHGLQQITGIPQQDMRRLEDGENVELGNLSVTCVHTPGHTPGSQCFLVGDRLVAGDTLFVQGCGRVDLPGGDAEAMYYSLTQKLAKLPPQTVLFPGHHYGPTETSTIGQELEKNVYFNVRSLEDWQRLMGR